MRHQYQDLIYIFNQCFSESYNTRLEKGGEEPVYLPADEKVSHHQLIFAHGFYASALHEIAHWCIAGEERRKLVDFGYWYNPDGRDAETQNKFEDMEVKPQALECLFCKVANYVFHVSCDNLEGDTEPDRLAFEKRVQQQVLIYLLRGMPARAHFFVKALRAFYQNVNLF